MKRFLIVLVLLSMLTASLSLCAMAANPTPIANPNWDLTLEFNASDDANAWKAKEAGKQTYTVSDGQFHVSANKDTDKNNPVVYNENMPANDANAYVVEVKTKLNFNESSANSALGFLLRTGDAWASVLCSTKEIKVRGCKDDNSLQWVIGQYAEGFDVSAWHTWRFEIGREANAKFATLTCFLDGAFVCSTVISNNTAAAGVGFYTQLPSGGETASLDVEYVKVANSFEDVPTTPETPDTPENPGNDNNDQPQAPATGIVMIPVVVVAAVSALGLCATKKRRG